MIDIENDDYIFIWDTYGIKNYTKNEDLCLPFTIVFEHSLNIRGENYYIYFKNRNDFILWKLKYNIVGYIHQHQKDYIKKEYNKTWWIIEND